MTYETELCHWGIKGQKWGLRRFQKEDGSLTQAGAIRYRSDKDSSPNHLGVMKDGVDSNPKSKIHFGMKRDGVDSNPKAKPHMGTKSERRNWKPSDAKNLSDEELRRRNTRLQQEQQYKTMTRNKAAKFIADTAKAVLLTAAIGVLKSYAAKKMNAALNDTAWLGKVVDERAFAKKMSSI